MNERIRELALEAGDYVNEVYTPPVRSKTPGKIWEDGHVDWHTQFNEKFAELIVRECAKQVDWILAEGGKTQGDMLKEHFGVEDRAIPILSADEEALLSGITSSKLFTIEAAKKAFGVKE